MTPPGGEDARPRTVQEYIDQTPVWPDGTQVNTVPLTAMQRRIWLLASAGKFFEGLVVFMTGVALPLIVREFGLNAAEKGMLSAAPLLGILVGATALGGLADRFGRKPMFIAEMAIFVAFLVALVFTAGFPWLLACLAGMGAALGCDYPTAHLVVSEAIPSQARGRLVLSAFGFQALGALAGTATGYLILYENPHLGAWRWMFGSVVVPAILVLIGRFFIPDSVHWLSARGRLAEAEAALGRLLKRRPPYPTSFKLCPSPECAQGKEENRGGFAELFKGPNRRATLLASLPWFLQDLGTYGIGIFTPTILAAVVGAQSRHPRNLADLIHNDLLAAKGAAFLDLLLLVGIVVAVILVDRAGRIKLQVAGFIGCAAGLVLAALAMGFSGGTKTLLIFAGFMVFNFMTNLGPNAQTYLLAGEVFPTRLRGKGAGLAASFAKVGAVATAFLFPLLLAKLGVTAMLYTLAVTSLVGAAVTWLWRIETTGVNLEEVGAEAGEGPPMSNMT